MNGSNNRRLNKGRYTRTYKIAPTTRAIRAALAVTATMLALGGSGYASAGTCTYDLPTNTETCTGAFLTSVPTIAPVNDMTLIVGTSGGTDTVAPPAGTYGIDAQDPAWTGDVTVTNYAGITTSALRP